MLLLNTTVFGTDTTLSSLGSGNYVTVVRINGIPVDSSDVIIAAQSQIIADFTTDFNLVTLGSTVNFTDLSIGALNYSWDFGDGVTSVASGNESHLCDSIGTFTVTLLVTNSNGCTSSTFDVVTVDPLPPMQNPNTIGQNHGNTIGDPTNNEGTSTESTQKVTVEISNQKILVNQQEKAIALLTISSATGSLVYCGVQNESRQEYALSTSGIYIVTVVYSNGSTNSWQVASL